MTFYDNLELVRKLGKENPGFRAQAQAQYSTALTELDTLINAAVAAYKNGYEPWEIIQAEAMSMKEVAEEIDGNDSVYLTSGVFVMQMVVSRLEEEARDATDPGNIDW